MSLNLDCKTTIEDVCAECKTHIEYEWERLPQEIRTALESDPSFDLLQWKLYRQKVFYEFYIEKLLMEKVLYITYLESLVKVKSNT